MKEFRLDRLKSMRAKTLLVITGIYFAGFGWAQSAAPQDPIKTLVGRLDLEHYKATIKALAKFGDRREGTDRNRAAVDWIEAQLKSYGCTNTESVHYDWAPFTPPQTQARFPAAVGGGVIKRRTRVQAGARQRSRRAARPAASPTQYAAFHAWPA